MDNVSYVQLVHRQSCWQQWVFWQPLYSGHADSSDRQNSRTKFNGRQASAVSSRNAAMRNFRFS